MNKTLKRYLISTGETFLVSFGGTLFLSLETVLDGNTELSFALVLSLITGAAISALKVTVKYLREKLFTKMIK